MCRLPIRHDRPDMIFTDKRRAITTDEEWQDTIHDQPLSISKRRQMTAAFLQCKMESGNNEVMAEGCHGMWELSISKDNHPDIRIDKLAALIKMLESGNVVVASTGAAAVWGLATSSSCRRSLADLDIVPVIVACIKRSLKMPVMPDPPPGAIAGLMGDGEDGGGMGAGMMPDGTATISQRATLQHHLVGALAMLLVDRCCRKPYITLEPNFGTLFELCKNLDGYRVEDTKQRRETAAKVRANAAVTGLLAVSPCYVIPADLVASF